MTKTTLNWTVKQLKNMHDNKETLSFNHPIQRQSMQWDNTQQSLLIHSLLASYPVPAVYLEKREVVDVNDVEKRVYNYSVLDGKQRMTTIFSFINGEYALSEDTEDVTIEDVTYCLSNKFFDELPEDVKQEILRFKFNIVAFENVSDEEIEEIFFRLNNSTPLTKAQKSKPLMGVENSVFLNEILSGRFFTEKCSFSKMQLKKSDDMCTLIQAMMLLDNKHRGYEYKDISQDSVMEYSRYINGNYSDEEKERIKRIVGFLDNCFYMKERALKKINIPILFLVADEALEKGVINSKFRTWFYSFFSNSKEEYSQYCSSGSIKKEKTLGRISVMTNSFNRFVENLEKDIPQPLEEKEAKNESIDETNIDDTTIDTGETNLDTNETIIDTDETKESSEEITAESVNYNTEDDVIPVDTSSIKETTEETIDEEPIVLEVSNNESQEERNITTIGDLFNFKEFPRFVN